MIQAKKVKIGFVIGKYKSLENKFTYGLEQHTFFLAALFSSVPEYEVSYVLTEENCLQESLKNQEIVGDSTPLVELECLNPQLDKPIVYDILIHTEAYLPGEYIKKIKQRFSTKFVSLLVGIVMLGLMEDLIFDIENRYIGALPPYEQGLIDENWISPHHAYHKSYVETLTKAPVTICPYIYEPWFLEKFESLRKTENPNFCPHYVPNVKNKHIGILEANIDLVKNLMIPACIVESLFMREPKVLGEKTVRIYSATHLHQRQSFRHFFDYFQSKNLFTAEHRYPIVDILHFDCNVIISHQHLCELNYLYLDALYYNIPLVHNSSLMKDYGYYYPDFDVYKGADALKLALETHDSNLEQYRHLAKQALHQFSIRNVSNIEVYKSIVKTLISR